MTQSTDAPKEPIPPLTDEDRAAAFPATLEGHTVHDRRVMAFVLFDQLEWQGSGDGAFNVENTSWVGGDIHRLWIRADGEAEERRIEAASVDVLWGRSVSRWWDLVTGVRRDFRPGDGQTWAAFGVQGLAPYFFEVAAAAYLAGGGRTSARFEAAYDLLFTNRFIAQPLFGLELYGRPDVERGIGAGLSSTELGVRFRYEIRREFAPYIGVTWDRLYGGTREFAVAAGDQPSESRITFGLRTWF